MEKYIFLVIIFLGISVFSHDSEEPGSHFYSHIQKDIIYPECVKELSKKFKNLGIDFFFVHTNPKDFELVQLILDNWSVVEYNLKKSKIDTFSINMHSRLTHNKLTIGLNNHKKSMSKKELLSSLHLAAVVNQKNSIENPYCEVNFDNITDIVKNKKLYHYILTNLEKIRALGKSIYFTDYYNINTKQQRFILNARDDTENLIAFLDGKQTILETYFNCRKREDKMAGCKKS